MTTLLIYILGCIICFFIQRNLEYKRGINIIFRSFLSWFYIAYLSIKYNR